MLSYGRLKSLKTTSGIPLKIIHTSKTCSQGSRIVPTTEINLCHLYDQLESELVNTTNLKRNREMNHAHGILSKKHELQLDLSLPLGDLSLLAQNTSVKPLCKLSYRSRSSESSSNISKWRRLKGIASLQSSQYPAACQQVGQK